MPAPLRRIFHLVEVARTLPRAIEPFVCSTARFESHTQRASLQKVARVIRLAISVRIFVTMVFLLVEPLSCENCTIFAMRNPKICDAAQDSPKRENRNRYAILPFAIYPILATLWMVWRGPQMQLLQVPGSLVRLEVFQCGDSNTGQIQCSLQERRLQSDNAVVRGQAMNRACLDRLRVAVLPLS